MPSEYDFEALAPENMHHLAPLMQNAFGQSNVDDSYFRWKYLDNPTGPAIGQFAISRESGEVAAFYGMIPELYLFPSGERLIYQSCDTMTHSLHRRRGLFRALAVETYRQARIRDRDFFAIGFGGPTSTPGFVKMGWEVTVEIPFYFKPRLLCIAAGLFRHGDPSREYVTLTPELCTAIISARSGRDRGKLMSEEFIHWRLSNSRRSYQYLYVDDGSYAIYYVGEGALFLFDLYAASTAASRSMMARLSKLVVERRLKGMLTFGQRHRDYEATLRRLGFLRNDFGRGPASARIPFITYAPSSWQGRLRTSDDWDIAPFDHDSY